jgi:hypothetical protein
MTDRKIEAGDLRAAIRDAQALAKQDNQPRYVNGYLGIGWRVENWLAGNIQYRVLPDGTW